MPRPPEFADIWLNPKQGTDAALALAMGHVILREYHLDRQVPYFGDYLRRYSDMPFLVRLVERDGRLVAERMLRASRPARRPRRREQSRVEDRRLR